MNKTSLYTGDQTSDVQIILRSCWYDPDNKLGMRKGSYLQDISETRAELTVNIINIVNDMYNKFPDDPYETASPFKCVAWFATCFLFHHPLKQPFPKSLTDIPNEQNAIMAWNIATTLLRGATIYRTDDTTMVIPRTYDPNEILSRHSFTDIISILVSWEILPQDKKSDPIVWVTFYRQLALLIEQVTYRAFPYLSYPPMDPPVIDDA